MTFTSWLRSLFTRGKSSGSRDEAVEDLRANFEARYHRFRQLLTANNKALDIMAEIEEALAGSGPLGMSFVRSRCTRVAANVFKIVQNFTEIAPDKYEALWDRFNDIQSQIDPYLYHHGPEIELPLVLSLDRINKSHEDQVGSKMANLGEVGSRVEVQIPSGYIATAQAYWNFMTHTNLQADIDELIQAAENYKAEQLNELSQTIRRRIVETPLPEALEEKIVGHYRQLEQTLGTGVSMVVRSSAFGEDTPGMSFAGQYLTEFNEKGENLAQSYKNVVASKYSASAMSYRFTRGIRAEDVAMCVGFTPVVDSVAGGVAYSNHPIFAHDDNVMIHSGLGLPKPVVEGSISPDIFVVRRERMKIIQRKIQHKTHRFVYSEDSGAFRMEETEETGKTPSLTDDQVLELAKAVIAIEQHYGVAQDVEWALNREAQLVILQSRAMKQGVDQQSSSQRTITSRPGDEPLLEGGVTASSGAAAGPVCLVRTEKDIAAFPDGAILVAAQAIPDWAILLNRAAGVITEQGGVASHLATVSRELSIPALFGVEKAMQILENGRLVTVDADDRRVYNDRLDNLIRQATPVPGQIKDSPVYQTLRGVADWIVPLHLLDPDSPKFRPRNCKSFHDIARFCHEKSVKEMFQFGIDHPFPERSSKQLKAGVPMQFWIIDLDDGLKPGSHDNKYVELEDIISIPWWALWRGMTAITWKGPPPVDTKGFLSVLMESAHNPALVASMPSDYANRNYFMISHNYLSVQSRFGYHFSTVEALVGERDLENYISFQFKGGAANLDRRIRRTRLVLEVLEDNGFRTTQKRDNVRARMEGFEQSVMEDKLEVLGYLIFHTRQLDMVMTDESAIKRYRQKISDDLARIKDGTDWG